MDKGYFENIFLKILNTEKISVEEAIKISHTENKEFLYEIANKLRLHYFGKKIDLCSIVNAKSGKCEEDCKWCSQSVFHNCDIEEYDLINPQTAIDIAYNNFQKGVHRFSLVTSGKYYPEKEFDKIINIYNKIKSKCNISLCASLGLINENQLIKLKEIGINFYHCNIETAPSYFEKLCTSHSINDKLNLIKKAKKSGLKVCSGGIIGMGESMEQRIEMAFCLANYGVDSIPINILTKIKGTKLQDCKKLTDEEILTSIAMFRLINPEANIRIAGGRQQIQNLQEKILNCGINGVMVGDFLTTVGTSINEDLSLFQKAGFKI